MVVVEHDREAMEEADWIVDFGPGAGGTGGEVVAAGTPAEVKKSKESLTGRYLRGDLEIEMPAKRRRGDGRKITVIGARENNLKDVTAEFPLGLFVCVTGVSGAGKSTLVNHILYPAVARALHGSDVPVGAHEKVAGPRRDRQGHRHRPEPHRAHARARNPATYTKVFDQIRDFFALLPEARMHGYTPGRFSFNVKGGRCEACEGDGVKRVEMHFLPDVYVPCEVCHGKRFNEATLQVKYNGLSHRRRPGPDRGRGPGPLQEPPAGPPRPADPGRRGPGLHRARAVLAHALGRRGPARQALARAQQAVHRAARSTSWTSPPPACTSTTSRSCWRVLDRLVQGGNTVVVIEHNLDVIKTADHVIDMGPDGGDAGGRDRGHGHAGRGGGRAGLLHRPLPGRPPARGPTAAAGRRARHISRRSGIRSAITSNPIVTEMGAMVPRWAVVDKLVHELGSLRAVVQECEAEPQVAGDDVAAELRISLARAADTIHLVIGGNEAMLEQAWRTITDAQEVGARARLALARSRAAGEQSRAIRDRAKARGHQTERHIDDLRALREVSQTLTKPSPPKP